MAVTGPVAARDVVIDRYRAHLDACNRRDWTELPTFLAASVTVNGRRRTPGEYVADVRATTDAFPGYRWELRRAIPEGEWLAVHLRDAGARRGGPLDAPGDGAVVETDEFDLYRIVDGLIHEVEGTADNARLSGS